jgi:hypothetical protein
MAQGGATRWKKGQTGNPAGKPKGALTKVGKMTLAERQKLVEENDWLTPLRFLMSVMVCEENPLDVRMDAAKAALPYIHRKMPQAVELHDPEQTARALPPVQVNFIRKVADVSKEVAQQEEAEFGKGKPQRGKKPQ